MDIPQGYKQTELGIIPDDWEVKRISDFTSIITGGTPSTLRPEYWGGNIMWMSSGELNKKFVFDVEGRITTEGLLNSSTHMIPPFCVLIGLAGQGKTRGTAAYNYISLCTNQSIAAILPNDKYDSLYLYYVVDSKYDYLRLLSSGDGGRGGLNKNLLNSLEIVFPKTIAEQRAIAEALSDIDGLIATLDKKIAKIMRKLARKVASDEPIPTSIKPEDLYEYLGAVEYSRDKYQGNDYAGVVTGLAWTAVGGEILFVESSLSKGKGSKLTLTGNLGDVMKESAMLALEYIHAHAAQFNINEELFENWNVHVHVPEGAIPKDGPSAGITMVTSLVSAFTQRKVKKNLAMTGEITLRGKVLPVGGIKEKILAAKRAGIKELILCKENEKDINEIKPEYLKGLVFHYVSDIQQVVDLALLREKVDNPLF